MPPRPAPPTAAASARPPNRRFAVPWSAVLAAVALLYVASYVAVALARLAYPFELEWLEGGSLQAVERVLEGRPLYARPTLDYVAFNYPPLYPWVSAFVARLGGVGFTPLRLVSFASSLGGFALIALLTWRETRSRVAAWLAAGLFAATYRLGGAWFDVARADSLYLLLLLGAFAVLRLDAARLRPAFVAGALFSLAFLAKQSSAMVALPLLAYLLWTDRPRFLALAGALVAGIGGSTLWLDHVYGGWYRYFLLYAPIHHPIETSLVLRFWPRDVALPLGLALLVATAYFVLSAGADASGTADRRASAGTRTPTAAARPGFYAAMLAGTALSAWFHRMYPGGYDNVLMPAHATISILFGLGWHAAVRESASLGDAARARVMGVLGIAAMLQFAALAYDPRAQVPRPADRAAGERFVERLRGVPGRVLLPSQPYLTRLAGKPGHFHEMAFVAVVQGGKGEVETGLVRDLERAVRDTTWSLVTLSTLGWLGTTIRQGYEQRFSAFPDPDVFWPVTGARTRPDYVYLPRGWMPPAPYPSGTR